MQQRAQNKPLRPVLRWLGGKGTVADILGSVVLRAAQEKWGCVLSPLPFDVFGEPGGGGLAVTCEVRGRLQNFGVKDEAISWHISDPAPGWATFMREACRIDADFPEACRQGVFDFDLMADIQLVPKASAGQRARFADLRTRLSLAVQAEQLGPLPEKESYSLALDYWLFNRLNNNGNMRIGSGRKRASWDVEGRHETAPIKFTCPVGEYKSKRGPAEEGGRGHLDLLTWQGLTFDVTSETYAEALPRLTQLAKQGLRVVVYIDPPFYRRPESRDSYPVGAAEQAAEAERALRRSLKAKSKRGRKKKEKEEPASPEWICTFAEWTQEGFPPAMWYELRDLVVEFVNAGGLAIVSAHHSAGSFWEETGLFMAAQGSDDAAALAGVAAPGMGERGLRRGMNTSSLEVYSNAGAGVDRRFVRVDWLGVAGLGRAGIALPIRNWALSESVRLKDALEGRVRNPWAVDRR